MAMPPAWMEKVLVEVEKHGSTTADASIQGIVDRTSLDITIGDKPMESIATLNQARVYKYNPEEDSEITFDMYVKDLGSDSNAIDLFFLGVTTVATSGVITKSTTTVRDRFRVTILFTNDTSISDATATVNNGTETTYGARRYIFADAYITSCKPSFTDGILKISISCKVPPYDGNGSANIGYQSLDGSTTASLTALLTYTGTVKGWTNV